VKVAGIRSSKPSDSDQTLLGSSTSQILVVVDYLNVKADCVV